MEESDEIRLVQSELFLSLQINPSSRFSSFTTGGLLLMLSVMNFRVAKVNILWSFQHSSRRCTKTENVYSASDELLLNLQIITSSR
nr:PREDICTED: uncharacterized protein LOC109034494 isoform X3 [Bemisia tabaci]